MSALIDWVWQNAAKLRDFAAILAACGTFLGVLFAVRRFSVERKLQREATGRRIWARVRRLSFDFPEYAEPKTSPHLEEARRLKYTWFGSNVFNALDEILTSSDERIWRKTAELTITCHAPDLRTAVFRSAELPTLSSELQELIVSRSDMVAG